MVRLLNHSSKRALSAGSAGDGGNTVATDLLGDSFIDLLRKVSWSHRQLEKAALIYPLL